MTSFFSFLQELECIPEKLNGHNVWDLTQFWIMFYQYPVVMMEKLHRTLI